ncbi:hypothetical protein M409DRAFT_29486 [Zasmidium cellare ATCC 36951]|uniref:Uncharacterized protein n=1 Tax=Zasmidium cellare ATCC 36951 TaxID=1080233 RepID=A0A6A6BZ10_ZASCE|nr:uncharacterized protein M409DRAFT_29486 [Zasmidium cellare ATCC 36951]KAF2160034.1 hypothetical protein M409DRAFT_29486 [Zasmidium cellare ATCC 36951]
MPKVTSSWSLLPQSAAGRFRASTPPRRTPPPPTSLSQRTLDITTPRTPSPPPTPSPIALLITALPTTALIITTALLIAAFPSSRHPPSMAIRFQLGSSSPPASNMPSSPTEAKSARKSKARERAGDVELRAQYNEDASAQLMMEEDAAASQMTVVDPQHKLPRLRRLRSKVMINCSEGFRTPPESPSQQRFEGTNQKETAFLNNPRSTLFWQPGVIFDGNPDHPSSPLGFPAASMGYRCVQSTRIPAKPLHATSAGTRDAGRYGTLDEEEDRLATLLGYGGEDEKEIVAQQEEAQEEQDYEDAERRRELLIMWWTVMIVAAGSLLVGVGIGLLVRKDAHEGR